VLSLEKAAVRLFGPGGRLPGSSTKSHRKSDEDASDFSLLLEKTRHVAEATIQGDTLNIDVLVIETRGERFPRIAVQLRDDEDPNALAHEIMRAVPDSGPVE
jgi:hypothetical protein